MIFLNLLLAGGLVAVSAPIIIHMLHRSRVMPHEWPSARASCACRNGCC
jgi:hypothetical protein